VYFNQPTGVTIMTTLREKMKQEMILIGLAESTQKRYIQSLINLQKHYGKSPAKLSIVEIRDYLLALKKRIWPLTLITLLFTHSDFSIASL
jgi:hypothetical protein